MNGADLQQLAHDLRSLGDSNDLRQQFRRQAQGPALSLRVTTSPVWVVGPYADRHACWGCGLDGGHPNPVNGLRLCDWCLELLTIDKDRQRRAQDRAARGL